MLDYWRERFPLHVFIPLAGVLALAAHPGRRGVLSFTADLALALLLLATTRLWDDLADREHDAVLHPDRILVRARTPLGYGVTCVVLAGAAITVVLLRSGLDVAGPILGLLYALLAVFYAVRPRFSAAAELVLLAKYPAFVLVIAGGFVTTLTLLAALMVYAGACGYEAWHDRGSALGMIVRLKPDTTNTGLSIRRFVEQLVASGLSRTSQLVASGFSRTNASNDKTNEMRRPMWQ